VKTRPHRGFTLLEMVMVVVILGIASITVVSMVANVNAHQADNTDLLVGTQLLQECAENIVAQHRRDENFFSTTAGTGSSNCYSLTTLSASGFSAPVVVVADYSTGAGCPSGAECKLATVTLTKSGTSLNTLSVMLVRYN
jgi:prepilin-type N-terminal cleavage/methylation domain-containing protein